MSSGRLGVLPRLRGVVPVGANDFSAAGTRWPVASSAAADSTGPAPPVCRYASACCPTLGWNAPSTAALIWSARSPGGGEPVHPVCGDQLDWLNVTFGG